jgi:phage terminase large subunit GpA-like protein
VDATTPTTATLDLSAGAAALRARAREARRRFLKPPPRLTVDQWADRFRRHARGAGATTGKWDTSRVEVARGPMRAVTEPGVRVITAMTCTQLLKSSLLENTFGYFAHLDPCPILLVQPKDEAVAAFAKERIGPLVKATPVLRALVGDPRTRRADDTQTFRRFPGGFIAMVAAGSPTNLAMRPIRVALLDEIDKHAVTREGHAVRLAEERLGTFGNSLSIRACSPTDDTSEIAASYQTSDQRRAFVPCPCCGHYQVLDFFRHVNWSKTDEGNHMPETAKVWCEACNEPWPEAKRLEALGSIRWAQTRPFTCCGRRHDPMTEYARLWRDDGRVDAWSVLWRWDDENLVGRALCQECGALAVSNRHAGFHASKLNSPHANDRPAELARKWLESKADPDARQTFYNTQLGLPHKGNAERDARPDTLMARREVWPAEIPDGVAVLTAGVDGQGDRLELEVVGWGRDEESWSIAYLVIEGDPALPEVWDRLDAILLRKWLRADGHPFVIAAACVDSGGHHTEQVYRFCRERSGRRVWAIKGEAARGGKRTPVWPTWRHNEKWRQKTGPVMIGVNSAKDTIRARLFITEPGPGFCHFPHDRDAGWFDQLTSERSEIKTRQGRPHRVWTLPKGRANEALDCRVYAYAALAGLLHTGLRLNAQAEAVCARRTEIVLAGTPEAERLLAARTTAPPKEQETARRPRVQRMSWLSR